ncbi:hypothetical protein [Halalkalibacter krulwichiae]|uniref:hypothetical protein n=1 Tax=Halalkalibacter krulwichiae TaxID=199441 RepID=UPI0012ED315F|nr:hypothetical protein [Halalkalibacter krulwichiae]
MDKKNIKPNEEYAHEFGIYHSVQESDAKIDLTKSLLRKKEKEEKSEKNRQNKRVEEK